MRLIPGILVISTLCLSASPLRASGADAKVPDAQTLAALEAKADAAPPRDQCFLYAKLVHDMTELAGRQLNSGQSGMASATLERVRQYTGKIRTDANANSKRLKNAQILMQHTSFRLNDFLHSASYEDRQMLRATLEDLNQVETQLMMQVFKK